MKKATKVHLDQLLVQRGMARDIDEARRRIMAGLVYVAGQKADKAGVAFAPDVDMEVRESRKYVSRGGLKLEHALKQFSLSAAGRVCLDVGASTGGFTDVLLQDGAARVYAVDVGYGQLDYGLRQDTRVVCLEKTHACRLTDEQIPEKVEVLVVDTSFISLERVLPAVWPFLQQGGWCVALIKPQFEVAAKHLRQGVVRDEAIRMQAVERIRRMAESLSGAQTIGVTESPIRGPKGNVEFLLGIQRLQES